MGPNERESSPTPALTSHERKLGEAGKTGRREWFRRTAGGCVGLAVSKLIDVAIARASVTKMKLVEVSEFTTSCNFCSCGCGMVASVRNEKLIAMEGDYDHIVNRGSLCVKGISMFATHASPNRPSGGAPKPLEPWIFVVIAATLGLFASLALNLGACIQLALHTTSPAFPHEFDQRYLIARAQ